MRPGARLVQLEPAAFNGEIQAGLVLGSRCLELEQHRVVDQLDIDAVVLDRLDGRNDSTSRPMAPDTVSYRAAIAGAITSSNGERLAPILPNRDL